MNINKDIRNILIIGIAGCILFLAGILVLLQAFASVSHANSRREMSLALARESSENSFGLTNNVRNYIASGMASYKTAYNDILEIRTAQKPRPATKEVAPGESVTLTELFRRAGFTQEEEALLNRANQLSGALAQIEGETMDLVEKATPEELPQARTKALGMLYGESYAKAAREIQEPVEEFQRKLLARLSGEVNEVDANFTLVGRILLGLIIVAAIAIAGIIWWLKKRVLGTIGNIAAALDNTGTAVTHASNQIADNSRRVSESADSQASSLAESASALNQMASMTKQNADNADKTNDTTKETIEAITAGSRAVSEMNQSMNEISDSSEQISRIIKTIEEIAFQTNLLALNAAVEAARAGESGKGFAVVADEVRNLAQRSAQSARDTASLIETTVSRVKQGAGIANRLSDDFRVIDEKSRIIGDLIQSITMATTEQARGMEQINSAVSEMDKLTQRTAADSRNNTEASEQLSRQAATLNDMTAKIMAVIGKKTDVNARTKHLEAPSGMVKARIAGGQPRAAVKQLGYSEDTF